MTHRDPTLDAAEALQMQDRLKLHCNQVPTVTHGKTVRIRCPECGLMVESLDGESVTDLWNRMA